jgi:hypothetical protein
MTIDSSGNVGIGTTSPDADLHINQGSTNRVMIESNGPTLVFKEKNSTNENWAFYHNAGVLNIRTLDDSYGSISDKVSFLQNGNVGIGTTSPDHTLEVQGVTTTRGFNLRGGGSAGIHVFSATHGTGTDGSYFTITDTGKVGIGTTSPTRRVHIASDEDLTSFTGTGKGALCISNSEVDWGELSAIDFTYTGSSGDNPLARIAANITNNGTYLKFGTSNNYSSGITNTAMTIDYTGNVEFTGNVGIGASPNVKFDVSGSGYPIRATTVYGYMGFGSNNSSWGHHTTDRPGIYFPVQCHASGGFHTYSDVRLKENVAPITNALDKVALMNGVTFTWDNSSVERGPAGKQFGVLAQNMLEVDSELPILREDPLEIQENIDNTDIDTQYYAMDYSRLTPFFIEATKELKTIVEAQAATITDLTTRLEALENA